MKMALNTMLSDAESTNYPPYHFFATPTHELVYLANQKTLLERNQTDNSNIECLICLNRGFKTYYDSETDQSYIEECRCVKARRASKNALKSGLGNLLDHKVRDYEVDNEWQERIKGLVVRYIQEADKEWFLALGQSGIGKTMLCSAICNQRLKNGHEVKYLLWREFVVELKRKVFDYDRDEFFKEYADAEILYIDDLFKGKKSETDIDYAFELINKRYNKNLVTIVSSELLIAELAEIDQAIAGRIKEKAKDYYFQEAKDLSKNYRFKG